MTGVLSTRVVSSEHLGPRNVMNLKVKLESLQTELYQMQNVNKDDAPRSRQPGQAPRPAGPGAPPVCA
ncbi:hypothetical protein TSUD_274780 [Trifolium subterraneum]|uniref:Uncharacterized protein n=1 Tax=Trifolium subterraneum TaxID=3900 RepID=A0A2Z6MT33_TRISU|nr:hypothetical protein TSUD_274780 [Trifolium subterraneum]